MSGAPLLASVVRGGIPPVSCDSVILSGVAASRSEAATESKDPYTSNALRDASKKSQAGNDHGIPPYKTEEWSTRIALVYFEPRSGRGFQELRLIEQTLLVLDADAATSDP